MMLNSLCTTKETYLLSRTKQDLICNIPEDGESSLVCESYVFIFLKKLEQ